MAQHTFGDFSLQDLNDILQRHNLITESQISGLTWGLAVFADIYCVALAEMSSKHGGPFGRKLLNSVSQIMQILACRCRMFAI
jgi:hypothetical protein